MEILLSVATLGIFAIRWSATWIGLTAEKLADHAVDPIEGAIGYQTCGRAKGQNRSNVAAPLLGLRETMIGETSSYVSNACTSS
jgi:hypothetical protein